ncbi:NAD/FAD-binding protein, partial [Alphaproteobacteria bacterium]|nr:NAD/FAD-binding protein [Alphaproteobacteria bacterium]
YEGSVMGLIGQPANMLRPSYWRMLADLTRFYRQGMAAVHAGAENESLAAFIARMRFSDAFVQYHLLPLGAAIWSCPAETMLEFPARSFMAFMENHQLLDFTGRPQWRTVSGGSRQYITRILSQLKKPPRTGVHITGLRRHAGGVMLSIAGEGEIWYDRVVMAAHADQSLGLITDASDDERHILGAFDFQPNTAILHSDINQMPKRRRLWASWNYQTGSMQMTGSDASDKPNDLSVTYWMNRLQNIRHDQPLFVTLNPIDPIPEDKCHAQFSYDHPVFDQKAITAQADLPSIQGQNGLYFCGAWTGYGFHEDGMASAVKVAHLMGFDIPWESPTVTDIKDQTKHMTRPAEVPAE